MVLSGTAAKNLYARLDALENLFNNLPPPFYRQNGKLLCRPFPAFFLAEVTVSSQVSTYDQYTYTISEVTKATTGYGTVTGGVWSVLSGGRSGTAYNLCENGNGITSGVLDNGITRANIATGFFYEPIKTGDIVLVLQVGGPGFLEFWIVGSGFQNAIDGACPIS